jgi:hypothetical protein
MSSYSITIRILQSTPATTDNSDLIGNTSGGAYFSHV